MCVRSRASTVILYIHCFVKLYRGTDVRYLIFIVILCLFRPTAGARNGHRLVTNVKHGIGTLLSVTRMLTIVDHPFEKLSDIGCPFSAPLFFIIIILVSFVFSLYLILSPIIKRLSSSVLYPLFMHFFLLSAFISFIPHPLSISLRLPVYLPSRLTLFFLIFCSSFLCPSLYTSDLINAYHNRRKRSLGMVLLSST